MSHKVTGATGEAAWHKEDQSGTAAHYILTCTICLIQSHCTTLHYTALPTPMLPPRPFHLTDAHSLLGDSGDLQQLQQMGTPHSYARTHTCYVPLAVHIFFCRLSTEKIASPSGEVLTRRQRCVVIVGKDNDDLCCALDYSDRSSESEAVGIMTYRFSLKPSRKQSFRL
jgi:hypothetical protein